jgi:hypothetical protein
MPAFAKGIICRDTPLRVAPELRAPTALRGMKSDRRPGPASHQHASSRPPQGMRGRVRDGLKENHAAGPVCKTFCAQSGLAGAFPSNYGDPRLNRGGPIRAHA